MRIVALDCATWWAGIALLEADAGETPCVVAELGFLARASHAPHLPCKLEQLLALAGWPREAPDGYVATCGPGSFTGIRVGLGTIRGLALAAGRPCAAVTTLDALAEAADRAIGARVAVISAGRGEFYGALYEPGGEGTAPAEGPWLAGPERLVAVASAAEAWVVPGHGTDGVLRELGLDRRLRLAATPRSVAAAAGALALSRRALEDAARGALAPVYLRPPDAELEGRAR